MFHKNDIDRIRNNIGCVGGRRSPKHSIDSASRGASFECFRLRSPPIHPMLSWNCCHHYGQKWQIHNNQPNFRPPNRCCYRGWWYPWVSRRRRLVRGWFGGCRGRFVLMRPWWFYFWPFPEVRGERVRARRMYYSYVEKAFCGGCKTRLWNSCTSVFILSTSGCSLQTSSKFQYCTWGFERLEVCT